MREECRWIREISRITWIGHRRNHSRETRSSLYRGEWEGRDPAEEQNKGNRRRRIPIAVSSSEPSLPDGPARGHDPRY